MPSTPEVMDRETAALEFERFASLWGIDTDTGDMDEESVGGFESLRSRIVKALRSGQVKVEADGAVCVELRNSSVNELTSLTLKIPNGDALLQWDKLKDTQPMARMFSYLGSMSGQPPAIFSKVNQQDLRIMQGVATLFLAS